MKTYIIESESYDEIDLPNYIVETLHKNDAFKGKFIRSCACKEKPEIGKDLLRVTYRDAEYRMITIEVTIVETKMEGKA